jgi:O-antigen/teichoic acid export membrane protein|uniref:Polysaccharide biosynthesis protein n=1 Tax=Desulfobacca acetoxidans TaxID=60893 RepID=A0A7V6DR34_9BACT
MNARLPVQHRLALDSALALGIKVISLPLSCLTSLAIARFWGAQGLGTFTVAVYLVTTLSVACRLGLDTGMLRFGAGLNAAGQGGDIKGLFWRGLTLVLFLSVGAAIGLFLAGNRLVQVFQAQALPEVLNFMTLALPISVGAAFCGETLRSLGGARWVVAQQDFLVPVSLLVLVGIFAWKGQMGPLSPAALGQAYLVSGSLGLGFLAVLMRSYLKGRRKSTRQTRLNDLVRYSWPLYLSGLLMLAFSAVDSLVLGFFTGPEQVAFYEAASRTSLLVGLPLLAVNAVIPPMFAHMHQKERIKELEGLAQTSTRWMYYVALPLALFMAALAPDILKLFGTSFGEGQYALQILLVAQLLNVACGSVGFLLAMSGNQYTLTAILAVGGAIGLPLMAAGAAMFGLNGLALAKGIWLAGINILMSLGVYRRLGLKIFASGIGWANASAAAGFCLFWLIRPHVGPWAAAGVGAFLYLALISKTLYQEFTDIPFPIHWETIR